MTSDLTDSFLRPWLRRITAGVGDAATRWPLTEPARCQVLEAAGRQLSRRVGRVLIDDLHRHREMWGLPADPGSRAATDRYLATLERRRPQLLQTLPLLEPLVDRLVSTVIDQVAEMVSALNRDGAHLRRLGLLTGEDVIELDLFAGDPHDGRRVAVLGLGQGADIARLLYKPRDLGTDLLWADLVHLLLPDAVTPVTVTRSGYGWVQFVDHVPGLDASLFDERLGTMLAIGAAIGATDLHAENVLAHGDWPVVLDTETCLQGGVTARVTGPAGTGLLPRTGGTGPEVAGLRPPGRRPEEAGFVETHPGTDAWGLARRTPTGAQPFPTQEPGGQPRPYTHRPVVAGIAQPVDAAAVEAGFCAGVHRLREMQQQVRERLLASHDIQVRQILRPTRVYAHFLEALTHPRALTGPAGRDRVLDHLQPVLDGSTAAEAAALAQGEIPAFRLEAGRSRLGDTGVLATSPLQRALTSLPRHTGRALRAHLHLIRAGLDENDPTPAAEAPDLVDALRDPDPERAAVRVLARLDSRCDPLAEGRGQRRHPEGRWQPAGYGSYDSAGLALLAVHRLRRRPDPGRAAREIGRLTNRRDTPSDPFCAFTGLLSRAWLVHELQSAAAAPHVPGAPAGPGTPGPGAVDRLIERATALGAGPSPELVGGSAGGLVLLTTLPGASPARDRAVEQQLARLAAALGTDALGRSGLAHGRDGLAWALATASRPDDHRWDDVLTAYVDRPDHDCDPREDGAADRPPWSWCWGRPGRDLARVQVARRLGRDGPALRLAEHLAEQAPWSGPGRPESLCHGPAGTALVLSHLGALLGHPDLTEQAEQRVQAMLATDPLPITENTGHGCGLSLFTGIAGLSLARLVVQGRAVNPLTLQVSGSQSRRAGVSGTP